MPIRLNPKSKARTVWMSVMRTRRVRSRVCDSARSSSVARHRAQPLELNAQQSPRPGPTLLEGQVEHQARVDGYREPGVLTHLALELSGIPVRVAESDERIGGTFTACHRREHVAGGGDLDRVRHFVSVIPFSAR